MTTGHLFLLSCETSDPGIGALATRHGNLIGMQKREFGTLAPNISTSHRTKTDPADVRPDLLRVQTESLLEIFLRVDRSVVEFFMHLYGVPQREMAALRKHNRRLHAAVRERHRRAG